MMKNICLTGYNPAPLRGAEMGDVIVSMGSAQP
jgi:hypothetical protein